MSRAEPLGFVPPRSHRPNRQQIAAAATRREILLAARRLFAQRGYAKTSVVDIAKQAGVSVPTIYASIGTKKVIVMTLVEFVGEEVGMAETAGLIDKETEPERLLSLGAEFNRALFERSGDIVSSLRSAAHVEPEVATAVEGARKLHDSGAARIARRLMSLKALAPEVSAEEAANVIALLTDFDSYSTLVGRYGWSPEHAEAWINSALQRILLRTKA